MTQAAGPAFDVAIVGGGLVGLAAAEVVAQSGLSCVHLAPAAAPDRRTSALMGPSTRFLQELNVVADPGELGTPLTHIRIIDATRRLIRAPETVFDSAEAGLEAFGWNFPNADLSHRLVQMSGRHDKLHRREAAATSVRREDQNWQVALQGGETISARLLVGADGKNSLVRRLAGMGVREHRFEQSALVANLKLSRPLQGESIEFHYENGPFTLVPAGEDRANLVWIDKESALKRAQELVPDQLETELMRKAQRLLGPMSLESRTFVFPLSTLSATEIAREGALLVGEAAHAFPPIGAQGLNLGLRDVGALAEALAQHDQQAEGWAEKVSSTYAGARQQDVGRTSQVVDTLFRSLLSDFLPVQALRAGGLWALKLSPALRQRAFRTGMGVQSV